MKPLGRKAYGSIPHLPSSRMGRGDHHCHEGQARIATEKARDRHDEIIVQEKLDGSCCAVARWHDRILPLTRAGYLATTSPYEQHHHFASWVANNEQRFQDVLWDGCRMVGEWLAQAHGTRYELPHEPFVVFDLMDGADRRPWDRVASTAATGGFVTPRILHRGGPLSVEDAVALLEKSSHGALDPVEGAVWRVERKGAFDFLAKWVRHDKADGRYLPSNTGLPALWHWRAWPIETKKAKVE